MSMEQSAAVYLLTDGKYIITVDSFIRPSGPWILNQNAIALEGVSSNELGAAVVDALSRSEWGIDEPKEFDAMDSRYLKSAGIDSWRKLQEDGTKCVVCSIKEGSLTLVPTRNNKTYKQGMGFVHLPDRLLSSRDMDNSSVIGELIDQAFKLSE